MAAVWLQRVMLFIGPFGIAGLLLGCGNKPGEGAESFPEFAATKPAEKKQEPPAQPVVGSIENKEGSTVFEYSPVGKRDPFWSFYKEEARPAAAPSNLPRSPLQMFEIDQLKLVAVVFGVAQPKAMVEAPDGKGYIVQLGTLIGKNYGRVARIAHNEVIINEEFGAGKAHKGINTIHLTLEKEKEVE